MHFGKKIRKRFVLLLKCVYFCNGIRKEDEKACNHKGSQAIYRRKTVTAACPTRLLRFYIAMGCLCNECGTLYRDCDQYVRQNLHIPYQL